MPADSPVAAASDAAAPATTEFDPQAWLTDYAKRTKVESDPSGRKRILAALNDFLSESLKSSTVSKDVETNIKLWIGAIDQKMTAQMNEILHNPVFQKLEGTWRG